jgi:signal transduction histidine kinase
VPLMDEDGNVLGAVCAIDGEPREWEDEDVALLADLAEMVRTELRLRVSLQEAGELEQSRSEMLAMIGHDLRGPLGVVGSMTRMLIKEGDRLGPQREAKFLAAIESQTSHVIELVDRLLSLEGRAPVPVPEAAELRSALHRFVDTRQDTPNSVRVTPGAEVNAVLDVVLLGGILGNLVDNATSHGGDRVSITLDVVERDGHAVVSVTDDGEGIAPNKLSGIFDRFEGRTHSGSHGLGLHIVRRLTKILGGEVTVTSDVGVGTRFEVALPLGDATCIEPTPVDERATA